MSSYAQTVCSKYPSLTIFFCFFKRTHATGSQLLAITGNKRKARQNMTRFFPNVCTWPENWDLKWDNFLHTYLHIKARKVKKRAWKILYVHFLKIVQLWAHSTPLAVQLLGSYLHHELRFEVRQFSEYLHRNAIMKAAFNETLWVGTLQYTTQNYISFCYAILKARM